MNATQGINFRVTKDKRFLFGNFFIGFYWIFIIYFWFKIMEVFLVNSSFYNLNFFEFSWSSMKNIIKTEMKNK